MTAKDTSFHLVAIPDANIPNTTLNDFKIRTPENINLNHPYEVALIESSVPFNIYNIPPDSYFCLARFIIKETIKYRKDHKYRKYMTVVPRRVEGVVKKEKYALDYAVRVKITKGFYSSVTQLKNEIKRRINSLLSDSNNRLPASDNPHYYKEALEGLNSKFPEFFLGLVLGQDNVEDSKVDALDNLISLRRMNYAEETGYVSFSADPSNNSENYLTMIQTSKEVRDFLGFPAKDPTRWVGISPKGARPQFQAKIYPHHNIFVYANILENTIVSNYECNLLRIIPLSAKKPLFGDLIWTEYLNPHYIPVNTKHISYIHFKFMDSQANPIRFENTSKNIQLVLHFRPIKQVEI